MRKCAIGIDEAKNSVRALMGRPLRISVNRGRKRIERYDGEIAGLYPSVIVLRIHHHRHIKTLTASYSDLICGDVRIGVKKQAP